MPIAMMPKRYIHPGVLLASIARAAAGPVPMVGENAWRCSSCLRLPYGVMPNGLYTPSTNATSNKSKARIR